MRGAYPRRAVRPHGVLVGTIDRVDGEHHHRDINGGGARAAVFGVSDGLVSNVSLILGMAGAHASAGSVRLAGIAGLVGGAFSMARASTCPCGHSPS